MRVYIETFGCQMNEADSEIVLRILTENGMKIEESPEEADCILLNTCAVRENAALSIFKRVENLTHLKRKNRRPVIGLLGCLAQSMKEELLGENGAVDLIAGPDNYRSLPDLIERSRNGIRGGVTKLSRSDIYYDIPPLRRSAVNAWVTVMRGCDNFCAYCVVPFTRGRERSRAPELIVERAREAARDGYRQITLLGQNVNSYVYEENRFADILRAVCRVEGIERVRFTSPHPKDFPEELLDVIAEEPAACSHIHLPLQSGSDRVLDRMNRGYTFAEYMRVVERIRSVVPDAALSTDLIAGFSGETDDDFRATLQAMEEVRFHSAFTFPYSVRRPTVAARRFEDDVPEPVKRERVKELVDAERRIAREIKESRVGCVVEVLIERPSRKSAEKVFGRTPQGDGIVFTANGFGPGDIVHVEVFEATTHTLLGSLRSI